MLLKTTNQRIKKKLKKKPKNKFLEVSRKKIPNPNFKVGIWNFFVLNILLQFQNFFDNFLFAGFPVEI